MKKINWKVRFKNKIWLGSFLSLVIGFLFSVLRLLDIYPEITEDRVLVTVDNVLTFLGLFGVLIDPTTEGMFDSQRALGYEEPWKDESVPNVESGEENPEEIKEDDESVG